MINRTKLAELIYKIKRELDYIEEDLLYCNKELPYRNTFQVDGFSVRITINELGVKKYG